MKDKVVRVNDTVSWIGIQDPGLITFDVVMETKYGTTYNSYFIDADKKAIIETSKENFKDTYLKKVEEVVDYDDIEYIILNHTEPDHSSNLKHLLKKAPNATVVGTRSAINFAKHIVEDEFKTQIVGEGDSIDLGNKTLRFIMAPFLHWPDTMYTYLEEDKILFTCDSFGCHYCEDKMFVDEVNRKAYDEAFKYYFDVILSPFSNYMIQAINKIRDLDIDTICPGHGPILRGDDWKKYVDWSEELAMATESMRKEDKVFMPYVSAYGNTRKIGEAIKKGIESVGSIEVELMDIEHMDRDLVLKNIEESTAIIVGTTTINQNTLLPVYELMSMINPIRNRGKLAGAFGSYGWSGEGVQIVQGILKSLKLKLYDDKGIRSNLVPFEGELEEAIAYGRAFGEKLIEGK